MFYVMIGGFLLLFWRELSCETRAEIRAIGSKAVFTLIGAYRQMRLKA